VTDVTGRKKKKRKRKEKEKKIEKDRNRARQDEQLARKYRVAELRARQVRETPIIFPRGPENQTGRETRS